MTIKEFSQKHSVTLFFTTIVLSMMLVFIVFSGFGRPGPGGMGPIPQGRFNQPAQGQRMPQQGRPQTGSPVTP